MSNLLEELEGGDRVEEALDAALGEEEENEEEEEEEEGEEGEEEEEEGEEEDGEEEKKEEDGLPPFLQTSNSSPAFQGDSPFMKAFNEMNKGDEEEEEDEDEDEEPKNKGGRPMKEKTRRALKQQEELDTFLDTFDFGMGETRIELWRVEPSTDRYGQNCKGFLEAYERPISLAEVKKRFGGGVFRAVIKGPDADGKNAHRWRGAKTFQVAATPIVPEELDKQRKDAIEQQESLVKELMSQAERKEERSREEMRELQSKTESAQRDLMMMVLKMTEQKQDHMSPILQMIEKNTEQQKIEMEARRMEAEKAEALRREEMRRAEEKEERRREQERREHELMLERVRAESQQQAQMQMQMMQFMFKALSDGKKDNTPDLTAQMLQMQQMNSQQQLEFMKQSLKKDGGMAETLATLQAMRDFINPQEVDDRSTAERVIDRVGEMAPTLIGGLSGLNQQAAQAAQQPPPQQPIAGPRSLQPPMEKIGIVENYEDEIPQPLPEHEQVQEEEPKVQNPVTAFVDDPYKGLNQQEGITALIQLIDLGIQKELSAEELFEKAVKPMPGMQKGMLKMATPEILMGFVNEQVPEHWDIRSAAGEEMIYKLLEILKN